MIDGAGMTERGAVAFGDARIVYSVVRSPRRRKTVEITVERPGAIVVAAPLRSSAQELESIVRRKAGWIVRHHGVAARGPAERHYVSGGSLPYLGRTVRLSVHESASGGVEIRFGHWRFEVQIPRALAGVQRQAAVEAAFRTWYRARAADRIDARVSRFAPLLGVAPSAVLVRDQRQRWGSCSPDGVLRFNWRIVMAPPALLDYVVIHELAHLRVRSHRAEYWTLVAQAAPDHRLRRERLRELGPSLDL